MASVFRSMFKDGDKPLTGQGKNTLGVRIGTVPPNDIQPDSDDNVEPGNGGMSVAPSCQQLKYFLLPKRFKKIFPDARGSNKLHVWQHGTGEFVDGAFADGLQLKVTAEDHGVVEPSHSMKAEMYLTVLAATRPFWVEIEV